MQLRIAIHAAFDLTSLVEPIDMSLRSKVLDLIALCLPTFLPGVHVQFILPPLATICDSIGL